MTTHRVEAWVLHKGQGEPARAAGPGGLVLEEFAFDDIGATEVLAEPIFGCWEGNMYHAYIRSPVDVCQLRDEPRVVLGNAGVVRVLRVGAAVRACQEGSICLVFGNADPDPHGYMRRAYAYDARGTVGLLARTTKIPECSVLPLPEPSRFSLRQWAAFSARYITAWSNWNVAYACWRAQMTEFDQEHPIVWAWGGGVALAETSLATRLGATAAMISSRDARLDQIAAAGVQPIDRREFIGLAFDPDRYRVDPAFQADYRAAEERFLDIVRDRTGGRGVSIFVDNIGLPVYRATLKALARQGVIATCGWRHGMALSLLRAVECIERHIHVHTHYARLAEAREAIRFAEQTGWMPRDSPRVWSWPEVSELAELYRTGQMDEYFGIYQVNPDPTIG